MTAAGGAGGERIRRPGGDRTSGSAEDRVPVPDGYRIRPLEGMEELHQCVRLQEEVWGEDFSERVPVAILNAARRLGGVVAGAFEGNEARGAERPGQREGGPPGDLVGFVFGLTGLEEGRPAHWSDMLAVRRGHRGRGLGVALKRFQREQLVRGGVDRAYWTFDPLRSGNAYLNFARLGAVAREYHRDLYGSTGSPLHAGIGTDRLVALWLLESERVCTRLDGGGPVPGPEALEGAEAALEVDSGGPHPTPIDSRLPEGARWTLPVPRTLDPLLDDDPALAAAWREATRTVLEGALARGMEVRELVPGPVVSTYLLVRRGEE